MPKSEWHTTLFCKDMCNKQKKEDPKKIYKQKHINAKPYQRTKVKKDFRDYTDETDYQIYIV